MAVSPLSLSPVLSPLNTKTNPNLYFSSRLLLPPFLNSSDSLSSLNRRSMFIAASYNPKDAFASNNKQELYERYGLDPNDFLSETSPKRKRRKEPEQRVGREKKVVEDDKKPPRTTHKLLQVLAGKAKRKKLLSPVGMDVRPMMQVVKAAAFDILQVHFVEMDQWVVSNVLQPNLQSTGFRDVSIIHAVAVENFLTQAQRFVGNDVTFDYISVTPPYMEVDYGLLMGQISDSSLAGENTFILVEYPLGTTMLDSCGCLLKITDRRFGRTHLAIYGPKWAQKKKKFWNQEDDDGKWTLSQRRRASPSIPEPNSRLLVLLIFTTQKSWQIFQPYFLVLVSIYQQKSGGCKDMGGDEGSSAGRRFFKAVFVALVLCIFMSKLLIDNLTSTETKGGTAATAITSVGSLRQVMFIGRKKHSVPGNSDLIAASKRRVPNGPDPIHNSGSCFRESDSPTT
ncbi:hypothetical protein Cgig2_012959 [Carnegiea gigantea]|uniref:Uncharacterized protein n=1 Tax=Carnegiea gigantea TaxID=171969 RepID=A0A9Q1JHZ8_9CARY|nr:hypothetical protein Cgig2_012959 [Carnegiea gigantea]